MTGVVAGNISDEATTRLGNIFAEAMRGVDYLLMNYAARTLRLKRSKLLARAGMNELLDGMLLMLFISGEE